MAVFFFLQPLLSCQVVSILSGEGGELTETESAKDPWVKWVINALAPYSSVVREARLTALG